MISLVLAAATVTGDVLHDFDVTDSVRFTCVNDTVMGGRSASSLETLDGGILRFAGDLSLDNNGGFASFRSRVSDYDIDESDGLQVRVKGDGRTYIFSVDLTGVPIPAGGYWQEFETEAGRWMDIRLPYEDFVPTAFGQELPGLPEVTADRIDGMGVFLADKVAGGFTIDFDSISTYSGQATDIAATGTDAPLLPAECSTLLSLLQQTGLDAAVGELDGFTLFAPTNEAFGKLPKDVLTALLEPQNAGALKKVLLHHVVAAPVTAWKAAGLKSADVLDGGSVSIERDGLNLLVGGSAVVDADLLRGDGVVHVVDAVIVPADLQLATPMAKASDVLVAAITRGVPLYNDGNTEACAAVYRTAVEATLMLSSSELRAETVETLREALARSEHEGERTAAWTLRSAMDVAIVNG